MKTLYEIRDVHSRDNLRLNEYYFVAKYVEHNGKKFRFIHKTENGDPCGFKTNKCIQVMNANGVFENVVDCKGLGLVYKNEYYNSIVAEDNYCKMLFKAYESFIKKVY